MEINDLEKKRVLILGFGREGRDTFKFLRKLFPKKIIGIADQKNLYHIFHGREKRYTLHFGKNYLKKLGDYDIIIKTPGIPFKEIPRSVLGKITTQTEIFFEKCHDQIVGITGTKGKGTTAAMIYEILKAEGIKAHLIGNIGKPVLNLLFSAVPNDVYVYELSSHQLYNLKKSPHIAVFLNLFADHLNYYRNFKEYANGKANITIHQKKDDYLVYNAQDKIVKEIAKKSKAKKVPIKGGYYELNKAAARAVGRIFKIRSKIIEKAIKEFKHLPHRLELVGTFKRITFYNDSSATIPEATIAAIETLGRKKVETIILGGSDKNIDFKKLTQKILQSKIKTVILFPTTGEQIWKDVVRQKRKETNRNGRVLNHFFVNPEKKSKISNGASNMKEAVRLAYKYTSKGKICLLSPACASFGLFKDYRERGNLFKKFIKILNPSPH